MLKILQNMYKLDFNIISHEVTYIILAMKHYQSLPFQHYSGEHGIWSRRVRILYICWSCLHERKKEMNWMLYIYILQGYYSQSRGTLK